MPVLACGSNAFQQLCSSDQLVFSDPVEVPASAIAAASWSQTLLRSTRDGSQLATIGLALDRNSTEPVRRWLGQESFLAALLEDGRIERFTDGARTKGRYALAEMNGKGEILLVPEDHADEAHLYPSLDALFDSSGSPPLARLRTALLSRTTERLAASSSSSRNHEHRIESIAAGAAHFLLLSSTHQVYSVGDSRYGQAGPFSSHPLDASNDPQALNHLSFFDGLFPIAVSCGAFHSAVVTRDGAAYLFGSDKEGQCGGQSGGNEPQMIDLEEEEGGDEGIEIVQVACGAAHTVLRTRDGQVWYLSSADADGQLGLGDVIPRPTFTRNASLETRILKRGMQLADIICSRASSYFVLNVEQS
ncbi:RCC1/BLIP-II protein [Rhodotorula sp. JG-1b]|nr:RCC1/BLIP-II protein [Rhodotorula sp. JG-1b]